MASLTGTISSLAPSNGALAEGVRRSRLSIHFNTPSRRRWLLVQLVSIPVAWTEEHNEKLARSAKAHQERPLGYGRLLEDYHGAQFVRRIG